MGISGNLKTMDLAELLQWLMQGQKTGTLVIDGGKVEKRVFFEGGIIISSASTDPTEYLGHFLTSHGFITEEQANAAVARQKEEKQLLGQILVGMNLISEAQLQEVLRLKAEEGIYDIFTWGEGDFEFLDNVLPEEGMVRMHLDVQWIVLEGSRRKDEWNRIREWVPSPLAVPVLVCDLSTLEMEEVDRRILEWVDDDRTVEDISQGAQTSIFMISQTIAMAAQHGIVKVVRPRIVEVERPKAAGDEDGGKEAGPRKEEAVPAPAPQVPAGYPQQMPPGYPQQMMPMGYPNMPQGFPPGWGMPQAQFAQGPSGVAVGGRTLHFAGAAGAVGAAVAPPQSEAEGLIKEAEGFLRRGELSEALTAFRKARKAEGTGASIASAAEEGEKKVAEMLKLHGVKLSSVPKLRCTMDQLTQLDISPQEGFMLTRIDGSFDIQSILKMSPMPQIDALILFWRLRKSGHVSL